VLLSEYAPRMPLAEGNRLPFYPPSVGGRLRSDAGGSTAPAMTLPELNRAVRGTATPSIHREDCTS
jgi:hypothetical protein